MTGNELIVGGISVSLFLSVVLRMIYGTWEVSNRFKPWVAVVLGMGFGLVGMYATEGIYTVAIIAAYLGQGFQAGAAAAGYYELTKAAK